MLCYSSKVVFPIHLFLLELSSSYVYMQIWNYSFGQKFTHTHYGHDCRGNLGLLIIYFIHLLKVLQYLILTRLRHINLVIITTHWTEQYWEQLSMSGRKAYLSLSDERKLVAGRSRTTQETPRRKPIINWNTRVTVLSEVNFTYPFTKKEVPAQKLTPSSSNTICSWPHGHAKCLLEKVFILIPNCHSMYVTQMQDSKRIN